MARVNSAAAELWARHLNVMWPHLSLECARHHSLKQQSDGLID
jgi:hypothetical protein